MEGKIVYFEKVGRENTEETLRIAKQRADELGIKTILVSSTFGDTAARAVEVFTGAKVVVVTHAAGWREPNVLELTGEHRRKIESKGGIILTMTHLFGGFTRRPPAAPGAAPQPPAVSEVGEIIANTLRMFGAGMKVVCEISGMAADAGMVRTDEDVVVIAGTGRGADTAVVLTPVGSRDFFKLRIKEILCKPHFTTVVPETRATPVLAGAPAHPHH